jgi:hypothetical protein
MSRCKLCDREKNLTFHHFIPKTLHKNKWFKKRFTKEQMSEDIYICEHDCHPEIHKFIDAKEMGREYNTLKKLKKHPLVSNYIKWVRKQD